MREVRTYRAADRAALADAFARAGDGEPPTPFDAHAEQVWLDPYLDTDPGSVFLAVDAGRIVGYLTGAVDRGQVPSEEQRINDVIREHRLMRRSAAIRFFARSLFDLARAGRGGSAAELDDPRWPAHLHVRLVPEARGTGLGTDLVRRWQDRLRDLGSPGCHLQALAEHHRTVSFFERCGFIRHGPALPVPGLRGPDARRVHQQTMVWTAVR